MFLLKNDARKNTMLIHFIGPSNKPGGICSTTSCEGLGLILILTYFSFANDVAQLQSARLNIHGEKNRLHGDADPSLSFSLRRSAPLPVTPPAHAAGPLDVFDFIMFLAHGPSSRRVDIGKCVRLGARMVTLRIVTPLIQSLHPLMRSTDGSTHNSTSLICKVSSPLHLASRRAPLIGNSLLTLICLMFKCNRKPLIQGNGLFCLL